MYLAAWDTDHMTAADDDTKTRARSIAESPWTQILAPAVISILGVGALLWQQSAVVNQRLSVVEAEQAAFEARMAAMDVRIGQLDRVQLSLEAQVTSSKEQIGQMRETMTEVRNYHAATMKEVREMSVQMARIEGALKKDHR